MRFSSSVIVNFRLNRIGTYCWYRCYAWTLVGISWILLERICLKFRRVSASRIPNALDSFTSHPIHKNRSWLVEKWHLVNIDRQSSVKNYLAKTLQVIIPLIFQYKISANKTSTITTTTTLFTYVTLINPG